MIFVSFIPLSGIFMQPVTGKILNPFFLERDISISQTCYLQRRHGQGGFALLFLKFVHLKEKQHFGRGRTRLVRLAPPARAGLAEAGSCRLSRMSSQCGAGAGRKDALSTGE